MKRVKFLVTCCLVVCLVLGGCTKDEPPLEAPAEADASPEMSAKPEDLENVEDAEEDTFDLEAFLAKLETMSDDELDMLFADESLTDDEFNALIEVMDARAVAREASKEPHGIIALIGNYGGWDNSKEIFNIISINPDSGEINTVSTFSVPLYAFESNGEPQNYFLTDVNSIFGNYRDMFSLNFDKLALTLNAKSGEMHAGWMDVSGNFIDVTEALLPSNQGDFRELPRQTAIRFDDECLVYNDGTSYLKVSTDLSPNTIESYDIPNIVQRIGTHNVKITDWIDETNCLVTYYSGSQAYCEKCNTETKQLSSFIPETSRCNWSGVVSPDGATVAFLSMSSSTSGDAEIFTIPLAGGDPIKVNLSSSLQSTYGDISMERQHGSQAEMYCYLLDWVE